MRSFIPFISVVFSVRQKLLDEDNLPSVFNLDDKAIAVAFDVEQYTDPRDRMIFPLREPNDSGYNERRVYRQLPTARRVRTRSESMPSEQSSWPGANCAPIRRFRNFATITLRKL